MVGVGAGRPGTRRRRDETEEEWDERGAREEWDERGARAVFIGHTGR
jgi:hypothetical protein